MRGISQRKSLREYRGTSIRPVKRSFREHQLHRPTALLGQPGRILPLANIIGACGECSNFSSEGFGPRHWSVQCRCHAMQQFGTSLEAVAHGLTVGDGNRGEFDESGGSHFVDTRRMTCPTIVRVELPVHKNSTLNDL